MFSCERSPGNYMAFVRAGLNYLPTFILWHEIYNPLWSLPISAINLWIYEYITLFLKNHSILELLQCLWINILLICLLLRLPKYFLTFRRWIFVIFVTDTSLPTRYSHDSLSRLLILRLLFFVFNLPSSLFYLSCVNISSFIRI